MKLYEIGDAFKSLEDFEGTPEEFRLAQDKIMCNLNEKVDAYFKVIKNLEADAECLACEISRMQKRKKSIETNIASMRDYLANALISMGQSKVKTSITTVSVAWTKPKLEFNESELPEEYLMEEVRTIPNIEKIREEVENGNLQFARMSDPKPYVTMR